MVLNFQKYHPLLKMINNSLIDLPTPSNISTWWNFGSLLGIYLATQILTVLLLATHYTADTTLAFSSVAHTCQNMQYSWLICNLQQMELHSFLSVFTYTLDEDSIMAHTYTKKPETQASSSY